MLGMSKIVPNFANIRPASASGCSVHTVAYLGGALGASAPQDAKLPKNFLGNLRAQLCTGSAAIHNVCLL
jgi:hypothetical protein